MLLEPFVALSCNACNSKVSVGVLREQPSTPTLRASRRVPHAPSPPFSPPLPCFGPPLPPSLALLLLPSWWALQYTSVVSFQCWNIELLSICICFSWWNSTYYKCMINSHLAFHIYLRIRLYRRCRGRQCFICVVVGWLLFWYWILLVCSWRWLWLCVLLVVVVWWTSETVLVFCRHYMTIGRFIDLSTSYFFVFQRSVEWYWVSRLWC